MGKCLDAHEDIVKYANMGFSKTATAMFIGVARDSLRLYLNEDQALNEMFTVGKGKRNDLLNRHIKANMQRIALEGKESDATSVGMKLLDKYDTDVSDGDTDTTNSDAELRLGIINELST